MAKQRGGTSVAVRWGVSILAGFVGGAIIAPLLGLAASLLSGWSVLAITNIVWTLVTTWPMDAAQTRSHATSEDPGRQVARLVAVIGSVASLGAVAIVLLEARHAPEARSLLLAAVAMVSVAASWALIQIDYMLRIAHVYYRDPVGGISFNQDEAPMYTDFAYFSFGLGMTYQVADTNVRTNEIRRIVIGQTLLAYLFGAVIIATVINLVTGLG